MQKADCSSPFDDLDAALRNGSEKPVAVPRPVTDLFLSLAARFKTITLAEIGGRLSPLAKGSPAVRIETTDV